MKAYLYLAGILSAIRITINGLNGKIDYLPIVATILVAGFILVLDKLDDIKMKL